MFKQWTKSYLVAKRERWGKIWEVSYWRKSIRSESCREKAGILAQNKFWCKAKDRMWQEETYSGSIWARQGKDHVEKVGEKRVEGILTKTISGNRTPATLCMEQD